MNKSKQSGITLISLIITIILILILTTAVTYKLDDGSSFRDYQKMCADIDILENKILIYYNDYKELPVLELVTVIPEEIEETGNFYIVDTNRLNNLTLNFGTGIEDDKYIINEDSFKVYYLQGLEYDGTIYYAEE